ncbi:MAG: hypothetical protein LUI87_03405 [Lachnospiraceae bacterium]|nr:hypothetical protein [Lachnospiraceae bacterium]
MEKKIPVLAFIIEEDVCVKPADMEKENPEKLEAFKRFVRDGRLVDTWKNNDELAWKVTDSLYKQISRTRRPGWIRGDVIDVEKSLKTLTELTDQVRDLTEENKKLIQENYELKQNSVRSIRRPRLEISLAADTPEDEEEDTHLYDRRDNIRMGEDGKIHLRMLTVHTEAIRRKYLPVNMENFSDETLAYITEEDIKKYNEDLPSEEELEAYLRKYKAYHLAQDCGIAVTLSVCNAGNAKATDVLVSIEFPKEIAVFEIENIKDMKKPVELKRPQNLEELAYERELKAKKHMSESVMENVFAQFDRYSRAAYDGGNAFDWASIPPLTQIDSRPFDESLTIVGNVVKVESDNGILHSTSGCFGGIYIIPKQKGEFRAKVTLMCAEYEEPEKRELIFVCE